MVIKTIFHCRSSSCVRKQKETISIIKFRILFISFNNNFLLIGILGSQFHSFIRVVASRDRNNRMFETEKE